MELFLAKAKKIRLLILDVDGVLTTGALYYDKDGEKLKKFHVHDGQGIKLLQSTDVKVAIITARSSDIILRRTKDLEITDVYLGQHDKLIAYEDLKQKLQLTDDEIAYIGDDLPDLPILRRVGLPMTVSNAIMLTQQYAYYVTKAKGGRGAVREVCDLIMQAQGTHQTAIEQFLAR